MADFDLNLFMMSVFDEIEYNMKVRISPDARAALLIPALEHRDEVQRELDSGLITTAGLREKVASQVAIAERLARSARIYSFQESRESGLIEISGEDVQASMRQHCAYLFWC